MSRLPQLDASHVTQVLDLLIEHGGESRIIGGCVRDALLGAHADQELDIATTLLPDDVEKLLHARDYKTFTVGKQYGTVAAIIESRLCEITTLREDIETDGRRAVVQYTKDWKLDAARRDFTINAMSYSPQAGTIYDYFGGQEDLKLGRIRFVGEATKRVQEDYLRILRFFRFYTRFGKSTHIDDASLAACEKYASGLSTLSGERKQAELYKILSHPNRVSTIALMQNSGVLPHLFEHKVSANVVDVLKRLEQIASSCEYTIDPRLLLFAMARASSGINAVVLLLKLSSEDRRYLQNLEHSLQVQDVYELAYRHGLDAVLYQAATTEPFNDSARQLLNGSVSIPDFPVTAVDLMSTLQLIQGEVVGKLLRKAEVFWCQSQFKAAREELLEFLRKQLM